MKTRVVYGVEATCEVLPASALPAAIRRRESVHDTMTGRGSADVYNESPYKDSSKASVTDDAHALSAQFLQLLVSRQMPPQRENFPVLHLFTRNVSTKEIGIIT